MKCTRCPRLCKSRKQIVHGQWAQENAPDDYHPNLVIMFIGEAPGSTEDANGRPFDPNAATGQEVRHLLWRHGLKPYTYLTNIVKCHPPDNADPTEEEIESCSEHIMVEITQLNPDLIITAGRFSTRFILGRDDYTMDMVSGIMYRVPWLECPVLPMVHPAIIFHSQRDMCYVMNAFSLAGQWGNVEQKRVTGMNRFDDKPIPPELTAHDLPRGNESSYRSYGIADVWEDVDSYVIGHDTIAIDTEGGPDGVWSMQISVEPGSSLMIMCDNEETVGALRDYIHAHNPLCIIHSALYDIPELTSIDIHPRRIHDTMVMAYLLQDLPLGLKSLAWRIANVKMPSYVETVSGARKAKALEYLERVIAREWPNPEPILEYRKGQPHVKQPQNISRKAKGIIRDVKAGKVLKDGPVEARKRWHQIKEEEGRGMVEQALGAMPDGYLCDIPLDDATAYACLDADMTLTIYPHLLARLQELNMDRLIDVEEGVTQFVNMMHQFGLPADREMFAALSVELEQGMDEIERDIITMSGHEIQLSSHQQVSDLLYSPAKLNLRKFLPKYRSKKMGKTMTGDDVLAQIEHHHPAIPKIREWRKLEKLNNTYAKGVPRHIRDDNRVHADFRTTNTDTGRLSCADPNLMGQPKRNKIWAKKMRNGFHALPGCVILSMDYSQIELKLLSEEANEQSMIRAFQEDLDIHSLTALETVRLLPTWEMETEEVRSLIETVDKLVERLPSKNTNFGIVYGITPPGLSRLMITALSQAGRQDKAAEWTIRFAEKYIDEYFRRRPGIRSYIHETEAMAKRYGRVWDWSGRIRRIPGARLASEYQRAEALRQACNARIQMGAQSIIKQAMVELVPVYKGFQEMGYTNLSPLIQIHDDIVSMVPEDLLDLLIPIQKEIMEQVHTLKAGVRVDVEYGPRWGEMEEWKT